jgi:methyl-accepting chemotaxis protein
MSHANHNNGSASGLIWKLMIAPAVVVLLLVAFGIFSYANLNKVQKDTAELNLAVNTERLAQEAEATTNAMHAVAYRAYSMVTSKDETAVKKGLNMMVRQTSVMNDLKFSLGTVEDPKFAATIEKFNLYAAEIKLAGAELASNPSLALDHIQTAEQHYDGLITELLLLGSEGRIHAESIREEMDKSLVFLKWSVLGLLVLATVVGLLVSMWVSRLVAKPLTQMQAQIAEIERTNDFSLRVSVSSHDEVGQTARSVNALLSTLQSSVQEVNGVMTAVSKGDLDQRVHADLRGDMGQLKDAMNQSLDSVQNTMNVVDDAMQALQKGDFSSHINLQGLEGQYLSTLQQASDAMSSLSTMLNDVGTVMDKVSKGQLNVSVTAQGQGDLDRLKYNINQSLQTLREAMRAINGNARQVAAASEQTSHAVGQISDGAQNQTHAISQVATAVRQTVTTVSEVSRNTELASQKSRQSFLAVRSSMAKMEDMVALVNNIASNSEKINKITEVIEGIANKTNLLSLNAAIEAARAGEHGKGFAVVADEVGKLAVNSAQSSQEIALLVKQAVDEANQAVTSVFQVSQEMGNIERGTQETDDMLQRIAVALEEQSAAVEQINANLTNVDQIAQSNASASEEITATVIELAKIADNTRRQVDQFKL